MRCRLSVVVSEHTPTRLGFFERLLRSIANQKVSDLETIVVVDGSSQVKEAVSTLVREIRPPNPRIIYSEKKLGASGSRNLGAVAALGQIVSFVDDDVVLASDWAERILELFEREPRIDGLCGAAEPLWQDSADSWLPVSLYWVVSCTEWFGTKFRETRNMWTMNSAIRRQAIESIGGFDEHLGPLVSREAGYSSLAEDLDMSIRLKSRGYRIFFAPTVKCLHHVQHSQVTFRYIAKRSIWIGRERRILIPSGSQTGGESSVLMQLVRDLRKPSRAGCRNSTSVVKRGLAMMVSVTAVAIGFATGARFVHLRNQGQ